MTTTTTLPTETERAVLAALREMLGGRRGAVQVSPRALARLASRHGLLPDLPPPATGMERLWGERLAELLCGRVWTVARRAWRVRRPARGNFWFEPERGSR